jgi:tellurite methyltransferase
MRAPPFPLAPWTDRWDPRPEAEAAADPIPGACNLPLDELADRMAELPPKDRPVAVLATGRLARSASKALEDCGRVPSPSPTAEDPGDSVGVGDSKRRLWRPNEFLSEVLPQIEVSGRGRRGRALDLACGSGREALLMASWGFDVTAVDVLPDALSIAKSLESRYAHPDAPRVRWMTLDLEAETLDLGSGFELVTSFRYLNRALLRRVPSLLAPGASLVCETFTQVHRRAFGKPRSEAYVLTLGELPQLTPRLKVERFEEGWHEGAHTARLWSRLV